jgi:hypothetical protein
MSIKYYYSIRIYNEHNGNWDEIEVSSDLETAQELADSLGGVLEYLC